MLEGFLQKVNNVNQTVLGGRDPRAKIEDEEEEVKESNSLEV